MLARCILLTRQRIKTIFLYPLNSVSVFFYLALRVDKVITLAITKRLEKKFRQDSCCRSGSRKHCRQAGSLTRCLRAGPSWSLKPGEGRVGPVGPGVGMRCGLGCLPPWLVLCAGSMPVHCFAPTRSFCLSPSETAVEFLVF